jgi:hypothetical protein
VYTSNILVFGKNLTSGIVENVLNLLKVTIAESTSRTEASGVVRISIEDSLTKEVPVTPTGTVPMTPSSKTQNLSRGAKAGLVIAVLALAGTVVFLTVSIYRDLREQRRRKDMLKNEGDFLAEKKRLDISPSRKRCLHNPVEALCKRLARLWTVRRRKSAASDCESEVIGEKLAGYRPVGGSEGTASSTAFDDRPVMLTSSFLMSFGNAGDGAMLYSGSLTDNDDYDEAESSLEGRMYDANDTKEIMRRTCV